MDRDESAGLGYPFSNQLPPSPHTHTDTPHQPPCYPFWETGTFTSVQDTILPSDDTEKKLRLLSMSSFCHLT